MLLSIEIHNINAINHCKIDFAKGKYQFKNDMIFHNKLVNPIAFYGTNGSGKSSFLKAMSQFIGLMISEPNKLQAFIPHFIDLKKSKDAINNENLSPDNALKKLFDSNHSSVDLVFSLSDKQYEYFIETAFDRIVKESLKLDDTVIFDRTDNQYTYRSSEDTIDANMYPVLRKLANETLFSDEEINRSYTFLSNMSFIDNTKKIYQIKAATTKSFLDIIVDKSNQVKERLFHYNAFPVYEIFCRPNAGANGGKEYYTKIETETDSFELPYAFISDGMENQSALLSLVLSSPDNSVMFIDEIENALHPITILDFIREVKRKNIQLIFSSHNTFLLQKLRPDQIFFANWKNGYSTYKKLSDIYPNIREINNIERMYLSSLFDKEIKNDE